MPPATTVESAFVVMDRASGPVRGIKREVKSLRQEAEKAGDALDNLAGPKEIKELEAFAKATHGLSSAIRDVKTEVRQANPSLLTYGQRLRSVERDTDKAARATDRLTASLERLNGIDARPRIHVDGIAEARAEIAGLRRELRGVGRAHPTATVGVRRGGTVGPAAGGLTRGGAPSRVGGGGLRSVDLGPFSLRPGAGLAMYAAGLPIAQSVGGAIGAGGASLAGAGIGAGAVGVAGAGVVAAGAGALLSVVGPAKQGLKDLADAQKKYNEAIADYGRKSKEAARSRWELHQAERAAPAGGAAFLRQRTGLANDWRRQTRPGQSALLNAGAGFLGGVRQRSPFLAGQANRVSQSAARQGSQFGEFLLAPAQMRVVRQLTNQFATDLGHAENTAEHLVTTFGNIARASLPFFHQGAQFVDHWTEGWARSTSDITATRKQIGSYVDDLRTVVRVTGHAAELVHDLFEPARGPGRGMLQDLDQTLVRWDAWAKTNPGKIGDFFDESVDSAEKLAKFIGVTVEELHKLADVLGPVVGGFANLASIGGGAGLLLPTALRMGAGQVMNRRSGGGGTGGGAPGFVPIAAAGGGGGAAGAGAIAAGAGYLAARGGGVAGRYSAGSYIARPEAFNSRYGGVAGARYAMPVSELGARQYGAARGGAAATRALGAAGRFGGPVALIAGGLGAASAQGPWYERASSGLAASTLGAFPVISGLESQQSKGQEKGLGFLQQLDGEDPAAAMARIQKEIKRQQGDLGNSVDSRLERLVWDGSRRDKGEVQQQIKTLQAGLQQYQDQDRGAKRARGMVLDEQSQQHAFDLTGSLQSSFGVMMHRGPKAGRQSRQGALGNVLDDTFTKMSRMRPAGAEQLGESMLSWAGDRAGSDKGMLADVDKFAKRIERRFSRMGKHIQIVDGQILTGTQSEWRQIGRALSDPAEIALEKVTAAFTEIQRQAVGSLMGMGYSRSEANDLVRAKERGGEKGFTNTQTGISARKGDTGASRTTPATAGPATPAPAFSPIGAPGPLGDGPGSDLASRAAPSGRVLGQAVSTTGSLMGANSNLMPYAEVGAKYGNRVTSGLRPGSITTSGNVSYHSSGHAVDMAGGDMRGLSRELYTNYGSVLEELITPWPEFNLKNGRPFKYDAAIEAQHKDHVHAADVDPPAGLGGMTFPFSPDTAGPGMMGISLSAPKSGLAGAPGALADAASAIYAQALMQKLGGGALTGPLGGGVQSAGGQYDKSELAALWAQANPGLGDPNLMAAIALAESGGNASAHNPSGASGLWQILGNPFPGNAMDPYTNALMAGAKLRAQGLKAWEAYTRGMHQKYMGDGLGNLMAHVGGSMGSSGGGGTVIHFAPSVNVQGADRQSLRREFERMLDQVLDVAMEQIEGGAEESVAGLMG